MSLETACLARAEAAMQPPYEGARLDEQLVAGKPVVAVQKKRPCSRDRRVLACASGRDSESPHLLGMAAHAGTIAVAEVDAGNAWLPASAAAPDRMRVGLYDARLRQIHQTEVGLSGAAMDVDLAFVPGGWVAAVQTANGSELIWFGEDGEEVGTRTPLGLAVNPGLAVGQGGEVLVAYVQGGPGERWPVMAALVEPRGQVRWTVEVFAGAIEAHFGSQVAADDGAFLIGRRTQDGVAVARVERSGAVGTRHGVKSATEYASLAWCGAEGRLVWSDFGGHAHIRGAVIDRAGQRIGEEHVLGAIPDYFNWSPVLCDGTGSLALLAGHTGGTGMSKSLDLTRIDREHGPLPGATAVLAAEGITAYDPRMVRLDEQRVAVGWIGVYSGTDASQLGLAVVSAPIARERALPLSIAE
ncbi:hypothetical protein [Nannocystis sp. SCPEA4]|uniref:hypothetical protein n=1 Tax=Nannocystis sp. SCPEA4 TaxID=2996787 RepID=UPI00226E165B|nr:hypothetical protein [Nannocystis sp. SCPEA4]MCY1057367.1 hypothetical protein [Nannocystis sp. SCPEA4]